MRILINNMPAFIKSGSSFDLISENRLFTGSDSYTLNIEFPLRGCPENIAIFGYQNRTDAAQIDDVFDCEIVDGELHKSGVVTVTERNETYVKTQFLEGRSALNYKSSFDDVYLNEMTLGYPETTASHYNGLPYDIEDRNEDDLVNLTAEGIESGKFLALPWVNNNSGNVQNDIIPNLNGEVQNNCRQYSFQPYLLYLTKLILNGLGYTYDFAHWQNSKYKDLICCNALPAAWEINDFARALPHWTVTEYFEQLEKLLPGEFEIDHKTKHVSFDFHGNILNNVPDVTLEEVVNEFSVERTKEDESEYKFTQNLKYMDCSHRMWKFYSCQWYIEDVKDSAVTYSNFEEFVDGIYTLGHFEEGNPSRSILRRVYYVSDMDTYFVINITGRTKVNDRGLWRFTARPEPINQFGAVVNYNESDDYNEIGFVPAWFDDTDYGKVIFLECNEYDESMDSTPVRGNYDDYFANYQSSTVNKLSEGEKKGNAEYYDRIYFAYWQKERIEQNCYYRPITDEYTMLSDGWSYYFKEGVNFRINQNNGITIFDEEFYVKDFRINSLEKYTFKFLSTSLPNPRAVFYIKGGKYLCRKLTATISEAGMSRLIKGEFYKIIS